PTSVRTGCCWYHGRSIRTLSASDPTRAIRRVPYTAICAWAEPRRRIGARSLPCRKHSNTGSLGRGCAESDNTDEILDVKTGASDQCSVNITLSHDAASVAALHRAPVKHT